MEKWIKSWKTTSLHKSAIPPSGMAWRPLLSFGVGLCVWCLRPFPVFRRVFHQNDNHLSRLVFIFCPGMSACCKSKPCADLRLRTQLTLSFPLQLQWTAPIRKAFSRPYKNFGDNFKGTLIYLFLLTLYVM